MCASKGMSSALSWAHAPFTTGQSLSEPMITATLRIISPDLSFSNPTNKKGCGTPAPRPLFLHDFSRCSAQSCTMPLTCMDSALTHETRQHLLHRSSPPQFVVLAFFRGCSGAFCAPPSPCYIQFTAKGPLCKGCSGKFSLVFSCRQKTFESFVQFRHRFSF